MFKHDVNGVQVSERGWAGHFCLSHKCLFHRNTLLEKDDVKIVVSSVGKMMLKHDSNELQEIGCGRYYETMVFFADDTKWHDADAKRGEIANHGLFIKLMELKEYQLMKETEKNNEIRFREIK